MPAVNFDLLNQAMVQAKGTWNQIVYCSSLPVWKIRTLTRTPHTIYIAPFIHTKDVGPVVLEIPPADEGSIPSSVDDAWQTAVISCRSRPLFSRRDLLGGTHEPS